MLFTIKNNRYQSIDQLRANTLVDAYFIIKNFPLHAADIAMDQFIQQRYGLTLKNMCIRLLLNTTFYKDSSGNLILMFKQQKYDRIAKLITYGNGAVRGSQILKMALNS